MNSDISLSGPSLKGQILLFVLMSSPSSKLN